MVKTYGWTGGDSGEVAFALADKAAVQSLYNDWQQRGLPILQQPLQMDFGYTFVALDPDGHRLRVFGDWWIVIVINSYK